MIFFRRAPLLHVDVAKIKLLGGFKELDDGLPPPLHRKAPHIAVNYLSD
jgi:hypothetical protein